MKCRSPCRLAVEQRVDVSARVSFHQGPVDTVLAALLASLGQLPALATLQLVVNPSYYSMDVYDTRCDSRSLQQAVPTEHELPINTISAQCLKMLSSYGHITQAGAGANFTRPSEDLGT